MNSFSKDNLIYLLDKVSLNSQLNFDQFNDKIDINCTHSSFMLEYFYFCFTDINNGNISKELFFSFFLFWVMLYLNLILFTDSNSCFIEII